MTSDESEAPQPTLPSVRIASTEDVERLTRLINAAFVVEQIAIPGDRIDCDGVRKYMRSGEFLVLENSSAILACVYFEKRGEHGYLGLLSVAPSLQRRGLGRELALEVEKHIRAKGCVAMDLRIISARPELLSFYEKLGYRVSGTSPMPPETPLKIPCHFIHLSKPLD
ncbi:MAG TPA: GNAT family N-acetyltransferase [Candidatus Acidoferrum sp.]|nr:GNAT family N-acetyltransferase [Candidatus Acidoferrum sp.]